jgi:hypothetical protein
VRSTPKRGVRTPCTISCARASAARQRCRTATAHFAKRRPAASRRRVRSARRLHVAGALAQQDGHHDDDAGEHDGVAERFRDGVVIRVSAR